MNNNVFCKDDCQVYFLGNVIDEVWVQIVKERIARWVASKGSRKYWTAVYYDAVRRGVLTQETKLDDFARLLLILCPNVTKEDDTPQKLLSSMYKFDTIKIGKPILERHQHLFDELDRIISSAEEDLPLDTDDLSSLELCLYSYLKKDVSTGNLTRIYEHPQFTHRTASFSVVKYMSEVSMERNRPSVTLVFECFIKKIDEDKVRVLHSKYNIEKISKLFIVSPNGFDNRTIETARECNIGLIRIDMSKSYNDVIIVLERKGSGRKNREYRMMLRGQKEMNVPFVVDDVLHITSSLADVLRRHEIPVKEHDIIKAPELSNEDIEAATLQLTESQVKQYVMLLTDFPISEVPPVCSINPYKLAKNQGIRIKNKGASDHLLGKFNFKNKKATIHHGNYPTRDRFSMAHELGHHILHSQFISLIEQDGTKSIDYAEKRKMDTQANYFASYLLMPKEVVFLMFGIYLKKELGTDAKPPLYLDISPNNVYLFHHIVAPVARKLDVSAESLKYRLFDLKLINVPNKQVLEMLR